MNKSSIMFIASAGTTQLEERKDFDSEVAGSIPSCTNFQQGVCVGMRLKFTILKTNNQNKRSMKNKKSILFDTRI